MKGALGFVLALGLALVLGTTGVQALVNYPPAEVKTEVWLDADGSGRGELQMYLPPNADKDALYYRDELDKVAGITLAGIIETGQYNWSLSFSWSDFKTGIGTVLINGKRTVTGDIIKLSFNGTPRYGEVTLHLPGTISQTNGEQTNPSAVVFPTSAVGRFRTNRGAQPAPLPLLLPPALGTMNCAGTGGSKSRRMDPVGDSSMYTCHRAPPSPPRSWPASCAMPRR